MSEKKVFESIQIHTVSDLGQTKSDQNENIIDENGHFH